MATVYAIFFFLIVIVVDFRIAIQSKDKKEVIIYSICLAVSMIIVILRSLDVELIDPSEYIIEGLKSISLI